MYICLTEISLLRHGRVRSVVHPLVRCSKHVGAAYLLRNPNSLVWSQALWQLQGISLTLRLLLQLCLCQRYSVVQMCDRVLATGQCINRNASYLQQYTKVLPVDTHTDRHYGVPLAGIICHRVWPDDTHIKA